ncbi:MAG: hypothetical protein K6F81_02920 [Acholeplasmatales bacterium]|nr:hypothetical protein [Acholeplasmatales bacterium]
MKKRISPYTIIILSFVGVVLLGTLCLAMPFASTTGESHGFVNSLFMSTSCVCVTGLGVVNPSTDYTMFGQITMIVLIEIGGLSFITIAVFFFTILGARIGVGSSFMLREALNQSSTNGVITLVRKIIVISFSIQIICAGINLIPIIKITNGDWGQAILMSLYHSAASFNNAGFDIFPGSISMIEYADNIILNITTIVMIVLGGIGFIVIDEVLRKRRWSKLSLHTKMTLVVTLMLITFGTVLIKLTYLDLSFMQSVFASVTCRTAGFTTFDCSTLADHPATYLIMILLMIIGASSCSTGGGVKTSTFAIICITIGYYAVGKKTKLFKRSIADSQIFKAFVLVNVSVIFVVVSTFIVSVAQSISGDALGFQEVFFEVVSAFSTTGLSMGVTGALNTFNRIFLCFVMLFGRLGPLTVIGVVNKNWMADFKEPIGYPEENVIIG